MLNYKSPIDVFHKSFNNNRFFYDLPLKVFGCFVYVHSTGQSKLDPRAIKYICRYYNLVTRKIVVSMDVTILENQKYFLLGESKDTEEGNFYDIIPNPLPTTVVESEYNLETH